MSQQKPYLCLGSPGTNDDNNIRSLVNLDSGPPNYGMRDEDGNFLTPLPCFWQTIILQIWVESLLFAPMGRAIIPHISILTALSNGSIHFSISLIRLPRRTACLWHISLPKRTKKSSFSLSASHLGRQGLSN